LNQSTSAVPRRSARPGESFLTPAVEVTEHLRRAAVQLGGYCHPMFSRPLEVSLPQGSPLPGQAVLLLMGGLVEQSGRLDDAIALVSMSDVGFRRPAVPGSRLRVRVDVLSQTARSRGRAIREMRWCAIDSSGETIVEATVQMLVVQV
jgi:hypothetical protein